MKVLMKNDLIYSALIGALILLPSCTRIMNWGMQTFAQAPLLKAHIDKAQQYIRSVSLYDQLTTRARFDALWLSDDVRINYVNLFDSISCIEFFPFSGFKLLRSAGSCSKIIAKDNLNSVLKLKSG